MADRFDDVQRGELERLVEGLRSVVASVTSLDAPAETLRALADDAAALAVRVAAATGEKPFARFPRETTKNYPYSPITGELNVLAPIVALTLDEHEGRKRVVARVRFSNAYEGPPSYVHGGMVAAMHDQVLAYANRANGVGGMTASLTVEYRKPTPLGVDLSFIAWTEKIEDRKIVARGECRLGDQLFTESHGLFIRMDAERARKLWGAEPA